MSLIIHPENDNFEKYIKLSKLNNIFIEVEYCLLKKYKNKFDSVKVFTVHGSNNFKNYIQILDEIKFVAKYKIKYIIYHDKLLNNLPLNIIEKLNKLLMNYKIKLLVENSRFSTLKFYTKIFKKLNNEIHNLGKCIDFGHILLNSENINRWTFGNYEIAHIHNNFGIKDDHNSLYHGCLDYGTVNKYLEKSLHTSLEVNVGYKTYLKNIEFLIQKRIKPFNDSKNFLNLDLFRRIIQRRLMISFKSLPKNIVCYAFVYGSFARGECHNRSDIDIFLCTNKRFNNNLFVEKHKKFCADNAFTIDEKYPIEIFTIEEVLDFIKRGKHKLTEDEMEIINSHVSKSIFICGDKKMYKKLKLLFYEKYKRSFS